MSLVLALGSRWQVAWAGLGRGPWPGRKAAAHPPRETWGCCLCSAVLDFAPWVWLVLVRCVFWGPCRTGQGWVNPGAEQDVVIRTESQQCLQLRLRASVGSLTPCWRNGEAHSTVGLSRGHAGQVTTRVSRQPRVSPCAHRHERLSFSFGSSALSGRVFA